MALGIIATSSLALLSACSSKKTASVDRSETITVDVYDDVANYMGIQKGGLHNLSKINLILN